MSASATQERLRELRAALAVKTAANDAIVDSIEGSGSAESPIMLTEEKRTAFTTNLGQAREIQTEIKMLLEADEGKALLDQLGRPTNDPIALLANAIQGQSREARKSIGAAFLDSPEFKSMKDAGRTAMDRPFFIKGDLGSMWSQGGLGTKDVFSALPGGTPGTFGRIDRDPLVEMPHRSKRVRDLFPARPTTAAVIEYFRVTGFTNSASVVADRTSNAFTAKPQSALEFTGEQAPVRTIAHWEAIHRNTLADEPQLQALIEGELLYGLRLHEDYQILKGTGTGEDLLGILNVPNVQTHTQADVALDNKADALRRAMTKASLSYYDATGIVVHDSDWEDIELLKDDNGQYLFVANLQDGAAARVWRVPVVQTQAMTEGKALVGAFGLGAQLYDREEGSIRIAEQHADFFIRNAVVILAEERLALATKRPEAFVIVTFT